MTNETLVTYLEKALENQMNEYDFALDWSKANRSIKISVRLFAENQKQVAFEDAGQVVSQEEILEFEDAALFFGQSNESTVNKGNYFTTIAFDEKKGLEKGIIDAFATSLKEMMDNSQEKFLDFVEETTLVSGMVGLNDEEIKAYFTSLSDDQQDKLLKALEKEELTFEFVFDQKTFEEQVEKNLQTEDGQVILTYPLY